jgi:hypothetical protein
MLMETVILYRPVDLREAELIMESGYRGFPPRLPEQPIFYPVLTFDYADQIAREWNTRDPASGYVGIVTCFRIEKDYVAGLEIHVVGRASIHQELWVPAENLDEFNRHIIGQISFTAVHYGPEYRGQAVPTSDC